jgi:hypothetical protein
MQHLMENAKTRMIKDYQIWYTEQYLPAQVASSPVVTTMASTRLSDIRDKPSTPQSPTNSSSTRLESSILSSLKKIDEHHIIRDFATSPVSATYNGSDDLSNTLYNRTPTPQRSNLYSNTPTPIAPIISDVEDDVAAFYKTRDKLLKTRMVT